MPVTTPAQALFVDNLPFNERCLMNLIPDQRLKRIALVIQRQGRGARRGPMELVVRHAQRINPVVDGTRISVIGPPYAATVSKAPIT
jgi:hypothetical protein